MSIRGVLPFPIQVMFLGIIEQFDLWPRRSHLLLCSHFAEEILHGGEGIAIQWFVPRPGAGLGETPSSFPLHRCGGEGEDSDERDTVGEIDEGGVGRIRW